MVSLGGQNARGAHPEREAGVSRHTTAGPPTDWSSSSLLQLYRGDSRSGSPLPPDTAPHSEVVMMEQVHPLVTLNYFRRKYLPLTQ